MAYCTLIAWILSLLKNIWAIVLYERGYGSYMFSKKRRLIGMWYEEINNVGWYI